MDLTFQVLDIASVLTELAEDGLPMAVSWGSQVKLRSDLAEGP